MPSRHGIIVLLAAGASLLLHVAVLSSFRRVRIGGDYPPRFEEMTVVFLPPEADPEKKFAELDLGEQGAKGYASHKKEGDRTAVAREAPVDQAALSLDPVGTELRPEIPSPDGGSDAAQAIVLPAPPPVAMQPAPLAPIAPPPPPDPTPPAEQNEPMAPVVPPVAPLVAVVVPPAPTPPVTPTTPGRGGADPAPMSDSESDAFSVLGSARFVNGELRVRAGRKVKSRRPKIGLAGRFDAAFSRVEVTLRVSIDKAGKVTDVKVVKSSGSNEIDQPCRVSMYDWWFEPKKDAAGNPIPDVFNFTIGFQ